MASQGTSVDEAWGQLADAPQQERETAMQARYLELAQLDEEERHARLLEMARAEYALPDDKLRALTLSRLHTLLNMELDLAHRLTQSYDAVMRELPGNAAMRRVSLIQALTREMSAEEEDRVRALVPGVFTGAPPRGAGLQVNVPQPVSARSRGRPWWAFWKKGA